MRDRSDVAAPDILLQAPVSLAKSYPTKRKATLEDKKKETEERCMNREDVIRKIEARYREVPNRKCSNKIYFAMESRQRFARPRCSEELDGAR